jgi:ribosomal subunit interface protein
MAGSQFACPVGMRIMLTGKNVDISHQLQAYTEYRFFAGVARYEPLIRSISVAIRQNASSRDAFICVVVVDLGRAGQIKTRARGPHPNAAIDRVADRVASLLSRRVSRHVSS